MKKLLRIVAKIVVLALAAIAINMFMEQLHPADAATVTKIYLQNSFHDPVIKPHAIYTDGGKDQVIRMTWSYWGHVTAKTGAATFKTCASGCVSQAARVELYGVQPHGSQGYFAWMRVYIPKANETWFFTYSKPKGALVWMWNFPIGCNRAGTCPNP